MKKKTVLITGASKGIGWAAAQHLASKGYEVLGIARKEPLERFPGHFFSCDLTDEKKTQTLIESLLNSYEIDALINNVGLATPQPLGSIDLTSLKSVYELNVRVAVQMAQGCIPGMKKRNWGRIVNISSRAIFGVANRTSYAAAKSALIGCTRVWAVELAPYGITANAIAPGPIETELFRASRPKGSQEEKDLIAKIPVGRVGRPEEIASAIAFLISEDAGFITGQTLCVDGGGSIPS